MSAVGDGELFARIAERDAKALERLYEVHAPYVMGIALRILRDRDDAEEVVQDVFWKLWTRGLQYEPERGRFSTWLCVIARNHALDRLRRRRARQPRDEALPDPPDPPPADPEALASEDEHRRTVAGALAGLSEPERHAIELAYYAGCSHSEIAARTGESLGTIKSRIRRATEKLRTALGGSPS